MGLVGSLLGLFGFKKRDNPTRGWAEDTSVPLVLDLDNNALSGVALGDPLTDLSFLGPLPLDSVLFYGQLPLGRLRSTRGAIEVGYFVLQYHGKGLSVAAADGAVESLTTYLAPSDDGAFDTFRGSLRHRCGEWPVGSVATEADILAVFGRPAEQDELEGQLRLTYYGSDSMRGLCISRASGRLSEITLTRWLV